MKRNHLRGRRASFRRAGQPCRFAAEGAGSCPRARPRWTRALGRVVLLTCMLALVFASPAAAQRYRPKRAGHPLRIVAYALHPVGVILDRLIFHPAWVVAQYEPIRTLVGMEHVPLSEATPGVVTNPFLEPYSEQP